VFVAVAVRAWFIFVRHNYFAEPPTIVITLSNSFMTIDYSLRFELILSTPRHIRKNFESSTNVRWPILNTLSLSEVT